MQGPTRTVGSVLEGICVQVYVVASGGESDFLKISLVLSLSWGARKVVERSQELSIPRGSAVLASNDCNKC